MSVTAFLVVISIFSTNVWITEAGFRTCAPSVPDDVDPQATPSCKIPGDLVIGGMYPVHQKMDSVDSPAKSSQNICEEKNVTLFSALQMEAFLFYLNRASDCLSKTLGFTLGAVALDSCSEADVAFKRGFQLIEGNGLTHCGNSSMGIPVVITGDSSNTISHVYHLMEASRLPLLVTEATSSELYKPAENPYYYLTMIPTDGNQTEALVAMLKRLEWNSIGVIYDDSLYSRSFLRDLQDTQPKAQLEINKAKETLISTGNFSRDNMTVCVQWTFKVTLFLVFSSYTGWATVLFNTLRAYSALICESILIKFSAIIVNSLT